MNADSRVRNAIEEITRRLVTGYSPKTIILFGSFAYGSPDADSDIDLLIVKETDETFLKRMTHVRGLASGAHPSIPFEPLVLTPSEVQERLDAGDQFIAEIVERGEVLYAAPELNLSGGLGKRS